LTESDIFPEMLQEAHLPLVIESAINCLLKLRDLLGVPSCVSNHILKVITDNQKVRDVNEGADIIMVKPALPYLDVIADASELAPDHPIACYQVSGEYAMVVAGANAGIYDLKAMAFETTESMVRAGMSCYCFCYESYGLSGATVILSYFTPQFLEWLET